MTASYMEPVLLCLAAALSWSRFISIFSADTNATKLRSPLTTIATSTFLVSASLLFCEADTVMALSSRFRDLMAIVSE